MEKVVRLSNLNFAPKSKGKTNLMKHYAGERLTQRQAIIAKCCDCMAYFIDGRNDCEMDHCPLYPFMTYRRGAQRAPATTPTE